jgi:hypothetical protein
MPWLSDLEFGERMELEYLKFVDIEQYKKPKNKFIYYDLEIFNNNDSYKIEVKADRQTRNTNNIFIEYECNGKSSGINVTTADYIVYFENYPTKDSQQKFNDAIEYKKLNYYQKKIVENNILEFKNDYTIYEIKTDKLKEMINEKKYHRDYKGTIEGKIVKGYLFNKNLFEKYIIHKYNNLDFNKSFKIII